MSGRLFGYARVSVASDADANNLENQRRVLADCEQVFEDVGSGASWNRPGLNRLKASLRQGDCVKVVALDRLGRSLTEVLELLGWLRENGVEIISLRESIDQDSAMGRAMLHLAIVFAEMERDLARERTVAGLERVKATGKHLGRRKGVSRKRAEEIQNMCLRDGLSWGRIAAITGFPSSGIRGRPLCGGRGFQRSPDNRSTRCQLWKNAGTLAAEGTRARRLTPYPRCGGLWNNFRQRAHVASNLIHEQAAGPEAVTLRSQQPREEERAGTCSVECSKRPMFFLGSVSIQKMTTKRRREHAIERPANPDSLSKGI